MIKYCTENDTGFGIVSKMDSEISTVGCYVEILEVYNVYENGSMDILVKGINKFQTKSTSLNRNGYIEAVVQPYKDAEESFPSGNSQLLNRTLNKFKGILDKTDIELDPKFWKRFNQSEFKSYKIAEKSGLNLRQQQNLLSLRSEKDRLQYLFDHFEKIEEYLDKSTFVKEIIMRDGYIN